MDYFKLVSLKQHYQQIIETHFKILRDREPSYIKRIPLLMDLEIQLMMMKPKYLRQLILKNSK